MRRRRLKYGVGHGRPLTVIRDPPPPGPVDAWLLRPGWVEECRIMAREGRALGMAFLLLGKCIEAEA